MSRMLLLLLALVVPGAAQASGPAEEELVDILMKGLNLALVLGVIVWFGRAPIRSFFGERRQIIAGELDQAAKLLAETERKYAEWERRMAGLDAELADIRNLARERAEAERARILADAETAAARIRRDAETALEQEVRRARASLRAEAADLAVKLAGDLLRERMTPGDGERVVDEFVTRVSTPPAGGR